MNALFMTNYKSHGTYQVPWLTLTLFGLMILLFLFNHQLFQALCFYQDSILNGEIYRILTGHFIHCTVEHLCWDLLAFLILGSVIERYSRESFCYTLSFSCLGVSAWLLCVPNQVASYC